MKKWYSPKLLSCNHLDIIWIQVQLTKKQNSNFLWEKETIGILYATWWKKDGGGQRLLMLQEQILFGLNLSINRL